MGAKEPKVAEVDVEGATPEGAGATETTSKPAATGATTTGLPEGLDLESLKTQIREEIKGEYEGKDGHIAKLRSSLDKQLANQRRELEQLRAARLQQARVLKDEDPAAAADLMLAYVDELQGERFTDSNRQEWQNWIGEQIEDVGLSLEDEEVAQLAAQQAERLHALTVADRQRGTQEAMGGTIQFMSDLAKLIAQRKDKELAMKEKQIADDPAERSKLVRREIVRTLVDLGLAPELTEPGGVSKQDEDLTALSDAELIRRGIAQRKKGRAGRARAIDRAVERTHPDDLAQFHQ
jgi:hypothetical protein